MSTLALVMNQEELLAGLYEAPAEIPPRSDGGKRRPSWMKPARQALRAERKSEWP
jgi:hypothetical protein